MNSVLFWAILLLLTTAYGSTESTTKLGNGCVIVRSTNKSTAYVQMTRPFLNCSSLNKDSFNLTGMPGDIASISFAYNKLSTFRVDDLSIFPDLESLDFSHNKISELVPTTKNDTLFLTIHMLNLAYNNLTRIPAEFFKSFEEIWGLDISGNKITTINDDDFQYSSGIRFLFMASNPLKKISTKAFTNHTSSLSAVSFAYCGLTEVPRMVHNMSRIFYLSLVGNEISNIQSDAFYGAKSLTWLELASNKIRRIDRMAFEGTTKLQLIDLTDNLLETLPPGVFNNVADDGRLTVEMYENPFRCNCSLIWLKHWTDNLHYSDIRYKCAQPSSNHGKKSYELKLSDFTCTPDSTDWTNSCPKPGEKPTKKPSVPGTSESTLCPKKCTCYDSKGVQYWPKPNTTSTNEGRQALRRLWWFGAVKYPHVDCTGADLTKLPADIRADVRALSLEDNKIDVIYMRDLKPFTRLQTLNLEGAGLRTLKSYRSAFFKNLTSLFLHRNNLTVFTSDHLRSFPGLKILRLYDNKIQSFPKDMFRYNRKLMRLYLGPNPVRKFDPRILNGLKLYSLSLRNMSLRMIPRIDSANLTYYDLSDNFITSIPNNTFAKSPHIFRLALDNNRLMTISPSAFNKTTSLRYLDLSENRLIRLPNGVFDNLDIDRLHIELWMNRFYCDCRMKWFKQWIEKLEVLSPMVEVRFMCTYPMRMHGLVSDALTPDDFTCQSQDKKATPDEDVNEIDCDYCNQQRGRCFGSVQMGVAIVLTMTLTLLADVIIRWCCRRNRKGYVRYRSDDDTAHLDMDS